MNGFRHCIRIGIVFVVLANTYFSTCVPACGTASYLAILQRKIRKAWVRPEKTPKKPVKIRFKIGLDGSLVAPKVYQSCGIVECDNAALKTVKDAAPFNALPEGATEAVEVEYTFDYLKEKEERLKREKAWLERERFWRNLQLQQKKARERAK